MSDSLWLLTIASVFLASILQTTTGAGLGLIVGPVLLMALGSEAAIDVAIILNLLLSVIILPGEIRTIDRPTLRPLLVWTAGGIPLGLLISSYLDIEGLKILAAISIGLGAAQIWLTSSNPSHKEMLRHKPVIAAGGLISGFMAASLAMPGPAATWALLRVGLAPAVIRANLRGLFVFAYSFALATRSIKGIDWSTTLHMTAILTLPLFLGMGMGVALKPRIPENMLRTALLLLLTIVALALFVSTMKVFCEW
jgi:uncharacterized protein